MASEHFGYMPPRSEPIISPPTPVHSDQIPEGYAMFERGVRLLSGQIEAAYYSTHIDQMPDVNALVNVRGSLVEGLIWVLTTPEFQDHETADDDRSQEIGNMMSYGISQGLTEEQVVECYHEAYRTANGQIEIN